MRQPAAAVLALLLVLLAPPAPGAGEPGAQPTPGTAGETTGAAGSAGLSAAEARGKRIYLSGESPSGGEITALMGDGGIEVPAAALPCASCHGHDGRGRPEGGVEPSDLTWEALTRPYTVTTLNGRRRGPYTPRLLTRAIGLGTDASGNELDSVMPRYRMSHDDSADLVAYLRRLGRDPDPGVGETTLDVGVLLPPRELPGAAATAAAVGRVTDAYARRVNADGGIYGRSLRLHYEVLPEDPQDRAAAMRRMVAETPIFALVASYTAGTEATLADAAESLEVPLVGPLGLYPDESFPLNRQVFHLDGGLPAQVRALAATARARAGSRSHGGAAGDRAPVLAVVAPPDGPLADLAETTVGHLDGGHAEVILLPSSTAATDAAPLVRRLADVRADEILLLLPADQATAVLAALARATTGDWEPGVGIPGGLASRLPLGDGQTLPGRTFLAYNSLPGDLTPAGLERLEERLGEKLTTRDPRQVHAFLAMDTLVQGLEATGRELTREGLIASLERVRQRPTGLSRPLSFGPNRRVAVRGAYVVELDPAASGSAPAVEWVEP